MAIHGLEESTELRDRECTDCKRSGSVLRSLYEDRRSKCCGELSSDEDDSEDRESITAGPQIRCLVLSCISTWSQNPMEQS